MRIVFFLSLILLSCTINGQEKLDIDKETFIIKLQKNDYIFSCFYSDTNNKNFSEVRSFQFPNVVSVYKIIMNGFKKDGNHKTYVLTNKDTVVRFEFIKMNGEIQLKIKHNNLINNYVGATAYLNRKQIVNLFKDFI